MVSFLLDITVCSSLTALRKPSVLPEVTVPRGQETPHPVPEEPTLTPRVWPMKHSVQPVILANTATIQVNI